MPRSVTDVVNVQDFCQYNAIVTFGTKPLVFPEMCHGCGGCAKLCPQEAISEIEYRIGAITQYKAGNITLFQGCIDVGVAMGLHRLLEN